MEAGIQVKLFDRLALNGGKLGRGCGCGDRLGQVKGISPPGHGIADAQGGLQGVVPGTDQKDVVAAGVDDADPKPLQQAVDVVLEEQRHLPRERCGAEQVDGRAERPDQPVLGVGAHSVRRRGRSRSRTKGTVLAKQLAAYELAMLGVPDGTEITVQPLDEDRFGYYFQPVEIDARAYAAEETERLQG